MILNKFIHINNNIDNDDNYNTWLDKTLAVYMAGSGAISKTLKNDTSDFFQGGSPEPTPKNRQFYFPKLSPKFIPETLKK